MPVILPTAPSGASEPSRMAMCPVGLTGLAKVPMTSCPASRPKRIIASTRRVHGECMVLERWGYNLCSKAGGAPTLSNCWQAGELSESYLQTTSLLAYLA